jgi:hypothetical protein
MERVALRWLVVMAIAACGAGPSSSSTASSLTGGSGGCLSPLSFGAVVNDGLDDRAAVQAALDASCTLRRSVCLPAGDLHIARRFGTGADNAWSLGLTCDGITVEGEGDVSRLVMIGSAKVGAMTGPGDWWLFKLSGSNHTLRNFAIDGATRSMPTSEQTHLIKLLGPARGMTLEGLRLNLPDMGSGTGGDCIQAGGEERAPVVGVVIDRVRADACDRSFVGLQRFVSDVTIDKSRSLIVGDQALDMEPTGVGNITHVRVRNSSFYRNGMGDGIAISLAGSVGGAPPGGPFLIESTIVDGSIHIYDSAGVTLRDLQVVSSGTQPVLNVRKRSDDLLVDHVHLEHVGTQTAHVVSLGAQTGQYPHNVTIRDSRIVQRTDGSLVYAEPIVGLLVESNQLVCGGPTSGLWSAIQARSVGAAIDDIRVVGNVASGNCRQLLRASATAGFGIGATAVSGNSIRGGVTGVWFENGTPTIRPVVDGNTFDGVLSAAYVVGAGTAGWTGSN